MSYKLVIFRKNRRYNAVSGRFGLPSSSHETQKNLNIQLAWPFDLTHAILS